MGALTSWYPQGLSRPVMGLLYLYLYVYLYNTKNAKNKVVSVHDDIQGKQSIPTFVLNVGASWRWAVNITPNGRLGGPEPVWTFWIKEKWRQYENVSDCHHPHSLRHSSLAGSQKQYGFHWPSTSYSLFCQKVLTTRHVLSITAFCTRIYRTGQRLGSFKLSCIIAITMRSLSLIGLYTNHCSSR